MSLNHSPKIVTDGLVLCLDAASRKSYPGSGTTWFDRSGNGNHGTLTNGPTFNSANAGSIVFDGVNDSANFSFVNPFAETVIVWARSATINWNIQGWISSSRRQNGHIIHPGIGRTIDYYVLDNSSTYFSIGSFTPADITIPHMFTYSTNGSNSHKGYLDGVEVASSSTSITRSVSPTAQNWLLGQDDGQSRWGNGNIYNCLRYNRVLSPTEIQQNFNATRGRFGI